MYDQVSLKKKQQCIYVYIFDAPSIAALYPTRFHVNAASLQLSTQKKGAVRLSKGFTTTKHETLTCRAAATSDVQCHALRIDGTLGTLLDNDLASSMESDKTAKKNMFQKDTNFWGQTSTYLRMDGWMDGWMDGRRDGWMDGWTDGWTDGRVVISPSIFPAGSASN